jgi:hypothetical protein
MAWQFINCTASVWPNSRVKTCSGLHKIWYNTRQLCWWSWIESLPVKTQQDAKTKEYFVLKSTIFWDIMLCSPSSVNRSFGGTYRLHLQGRKNNLSKKSVWTQVASISQKMVLFITTAVRTSNPTKYFVLF